MAQWLVTQGSNQFSVDGLAQLKGMASAGDLRGGDLIQPPGSSEWMYAIEVPGLEELLPPEEDDFEVGAGGGRTRVLAAVFAVVLVAFGSAAFYYSQQLPRGNEVLIGRGGLTYSEMIVTEPNQVLTADPSPSGASVRALEKDTVLELVAKRGDFYRARAKDGAEGWIAQGAVIPMYQLGGQDVRDEFDPLYNPDRYVNVANASWLPMPEEKGKEEEGHITIFQFYLHNQSKYRMDNMVIQAVIKDAKGSELEKVEIPVEGQINPNGGTMVGTLQPSEDAPEDAEPRLMTTHMFQDLAKTDPDLQLRYSEGVEVRMDTDKFTNANIEIIELRAVPDDEAAEQVTSRG